MVLAIKKKNVKWDIEKIKKFVEVESNSGCELLSKEYTIATEKMNFRCKCREIFVASWTKFKHRNKRQCNDCGYNITRQLKLKTHEEFILEVLSLVGNEYEVAGKYSNSHTDTSFYHVKCSREFEMTPSNFLRYQRCSLCSQEAKNRKATKTAKFFLGEVFEMVGSEYTFLEEYTKADVPILVKHGICNHEYKVTPNHFLIDGTRCPNCDLKRRAHLQLQNRKTHDFFTKEVYELTDGDYAVIGKYETAIKKIEFLHLDCNRKFPMEPTNFLSGQRCPHCRLSKGSVAIYDLLIRKSVAYELEKRFEGCRVVKPLPFDFYIKDRILIEFDGQQHFLPVQFGGVSKKEAALASENVQRRDKIKNKYCIDNNIPLIRIPYWEYNNIEVILESALAHFNIIEMDNSDKDRFIEYLVDENWNHDEYLSKCPKNQKEARKLA